MNTTCFNKCVTIFDSNMISGEEALCVDHCTKKYIEVNKLIIENQLKKAN